MDPTKSEPQPAETGNVKHPGSGARGRGRVRGRGRGRRVVPRQVARRKPPPKQGIAAPERQERSASSGENRGRGRGAVRRGRGGPRSAPVYSPNVVGLGQIAPPKAPVSRVPSSAGSAASSHRSSAVSSISLGSLGAASSTGGVSSTGAASSSTGIGLADGAIDMDIAMGAMKEEDLDSAAGVSRQRGKAKKDREMKFEEHIETGYDSDDDMPDDSFEQRNRDIAPYAGHLTEDGILLPVSLPGLRDLPPCFEEFIDDPIIPNISKDKADEHMLITEAKPEAKAEPMQFETHNFSAIQPLSPKSFANGTVARKILTSESTLVFMQLPGLLTLSENPAAGNIGEEQRPHEPSKQSSVAAAVSAGERMRALGTDLRRVGEPGKSRYMGKLRFFKSGRVQLVMQCGEVIDLENGAEPKVCQQVLLIDTDKKTCDEMSNGYLPKVVGVPSLGLG